MMLEPLAIAGSFGRYHLAAALAPTVVYPAYLGAGPDDGVFALYTAPAFLAEDPEFRLALRHGAVAATRLTHRFVTPVFDVDADAETPWVAVPFAAGVTLDEQIAAHGPLPEDAARTLAAALAEALTAIHAAGLVHRSLRPDTVSLTRDGIRVTGTGLPPVLEFPHAARHPEAIPGPPDYLSPEQTVGAEIGPASDVFAFGAVLAFAASGVRPFGAPSVPYTLFTIAQREPDLGTVPASLRPLVTACLRKDPRTRPTAAQVLEYLGAPEVSPPPWPAAVLVETDRRERAAAAAIGACRAEFQRVDRGPRVVAADTLRRAVRGGRGMAGAVRRFAGRTGPRTRIALALAVAAVLVAAVGVTVLREPPEPVTALSLEQLRRIDACAWLKSAMGEEIPLRSGPAAIDRWQLSTSDDWGCYAGLERTSPGDERTSFGLFPGDQLEFMTPADTVVDGVTIRHAMSCGRAVAALDNDEAGLVLQQIGGVDDRPCEPVLDQLAATLARTLAEAPTLADAKSSLATIDPCAALDRQALDAEIGPLPERPVIGDAHTCEWAGRRNVTLTFDRGGHEPGPMDFTRTTAGDLDLYRFAGEDGAFCTVAYRFREVDATTAELVTLRLSGAEGEADRHCDSAVTMLRRVVGNLPR